MTALLLDTHAWLWLAAGQRRIARRARLLERAAHAGELLVATVSLYEATQIGTETELGKRRGKQAVQMRPSVEQWIRDALILTRVTPVALDVDMAIDGALALAMHADPFDRLIVATALWSRARLVTADEAIVAYAKTSGLAVVEL